MHVRSLERFDFDSVLFPWNHALAAVDEYRRDAEELIAVCQTAGVAMQTIKSVAKRRWENPTARHFSWYEPLDEGGALGRAVRFVMSTPDVFLNTSSDARLLRAIVAAATGPNANTRPSADELATDVATHHISPLFDGRNLERI